MDSQRPLTDVRITLKTDKGEYGFKPFEIFPGFERPNFIESISLEVNGIPIGTLRFTIEGEVH